MGADLYLMAKYKPNQDKYEPQFNEMVKLRDSLLDPKAKAAAQKEVEYYYEQMNREGYFRDSYNDSNLLWKFGLDYWTWFAGLLDEEGNLPPDKAQVVLDKLTENESQFDQAMSKLNDPEAEQYFYDKYADFRSFLNEAIRLNEPIKCSI